MTTAQRFAPHIELATALLPHVHDLTSDASHDLSHLMRVWTNVQRITAREGGDLQVLTAATLLHDCVDVPKDSGQRAMASRLAADKATTLLRDLNWPEAQIDAAAHAITAHSFSANVAPQTLEAKILQDADRLDAIGHIGVARCLYVSGRLNRAIYDPDDPIGADRPLDELQFAMDHFQTKLLKLTAGFQTITGQALAAERHQTVQSFFDGLMAEVTPQPS